jgi:hypothetical protein
MFEPFAGFNTSFTMVFVAEGSRSTAVIVPACSIFSARRAASFSSPFCGVSPNVEKQLSSVAMPREVIFLFMGV